MLLIVSLVLSKYGSGEGGGKKFTLRQGLPWFIVGFVALVTLNSLVTLPEIVIETGNRTASTLLLFAVIAAAIKSNLAGLLSHGLRSFGPVIMTTLTAFALSLLAVQML